ncbi:MAG TPA: ribonuclease P protein component [Clostridia bacterium]|nr:ribonuclease P protein component [Clostridia bacterium]
MPKITTLKQNRDFRRLYGRGKSHTHPALVTYVLKNRAGVCRIGITTGKKLGCAVERNRCRRIIKEAFRQNAPLCSGGWDIVFVARHKTKRLKSTRIESIMREHLKASGIIKDAEPTDR